MDCAIGRPGRRTPGAALTRARLEAPGWRPWLQADADEGGLIGQLDAEGVPDAGHDLPGQGDQIGRARATGVGECEGVLGRNAGATGALKALGEACLLDQPAGR